MRTWAAGGGIPCRFWNRRMFHAASRRRAPLCRRCGRHSQPRPLCDCAERLERTAHSALWKAETRAFRAKSASGGWGRALRCASSARRRRSAFDSRCDGYANVLDDRQPPAPIPLHPAICPKCRNAAFQLRLTFEYPEAEELAAFANPDDMFTWVWVTMRCTRCHAVFRGDLECD